MTVASNFFPEVIILAGGLGKRLRSVSEKVPKPLVDVNGVPFLVLLLREIYSQGARRVTLSICYKAEQFPTALAPFSSEFPNLEIIFSVDENPLGTGGALARAILNLTSTSKTRPFLVLNGDTFLDINYKKFLLLHENNNADLSIALFETENTERFGIVKIDNDNNVKGFVEKSAKQNKSFQFINAGAYIFNHDLISSIDKNKNSLENQIAIWIRDKKIVKGFPLVKQFDDIGIPSDFFKFREKAERNVD